VALAKGSPIPKINSICSVLVQFTKNPTRLFDSHHNFDIPAQLRVIQNATNSTQISSLILAMSGTLPKQLLQGKSVEPQIL